VLQQESIKAQCVSRVHRLNSVIKHGLGLKGVCASGGSGDKTNSISHFSWPTSTIRYRKRSPFYTVCATFNMVH